VQFPISKSLAIKAVLLATAWLVVSPAKSEEVSAAALAAGEALFKSRCAVCHENKYPKAPFVHYLRQMMPQGIYAILTEGAMRPYAAGLEDREKRLIAEYLSGYSMSELRPGRPQPACGASSPSFEASRMPAVRSWGIDLENSRFTPGDVARLSAAQVRNLRLEWAFSFPGAQRARAQPTAAGGRIFVGGQSGEVHALDAKTGCRHWAFRASGEVRTAITIDAASNLYFGDTFGNVYSISAADGGGRWKVKVDDHPAATITGSPVVHAGTVFVPLSAMGNFDVADPKSTCCTNRGAVIALDANDGRILWKTYTIPEPPREQLRNHAGTPQFGPAGASVMTSPTIDEQRGLLYIGTGQNHGVVTDENSDAVMALSMKDGRIVWKTQTTARDTWPASPFRSKDSNDVFLDFDFSASPILVHGPQGRDILVAGQKSGEAFGFDPDTGHILWRNKLGRGGAAGGIHFSLARDGDTIFVPMHDSPYGLDEIFPALTEPAQPGMNAVDAFTGRTLWRKPVSDYCAKQEGCRGISAAITAVPGVVFAARRDGGLEAFEGTTGEVIWSFDTARAFTALNGDRAHGGSIAGAGPLVIDGMLYINSGYGIYESDAGNVLLAFSVGGE
jgi:polyvinyl alcohol dehydrogenase (cytochrome)